MKRSYKTYYRLRPLIPRHFQIFLRKKIARKILYASHGRWPVDRNSNRKPFEWTSWPENKKFALVLTHDVDTISGHNRCIKLARMEQKRAFRSSFNFVPERYPVSVELLSYLVRRGFEVGVHGLYHDGRLYESRELFLERSIKIKKYLRQWGAVGFRSPSMQHNLDWIQDLGILYDTSTFDTDPFEPQPEGVGTIFPFWVSANGNGNGFVELPYTLPQDFTLFVLLNQKSVETWEKKLDWIVEHGGMALLNTHPDYMNFNKKKSRYGEYRVEYYEQFLDIIESKYGGNYWNALPRELAAFWRSNITDNQR